MVNYPITKGRTWNGRPLEYFTGTKHRTIETARPSYIPFSSDVY